MTLAFRALALAPIIAGALFIAAPTRAATVPEPLIRMSDALKDVDAARGDLNVQVTEYSGSRKVLSGTVKGHILADMETKNMEGKATVNLQGEGLNNLLGMKKLTGAFDFRMLADDGDLYVRVTKFPKFKLFDFTKAAKRWIRIEMPGGNPFLADVPTSPEDDYFAEVQSRYPAFVLTERGSTKREYVYDYRVNLDLLPAFIVESQRLQGEYLSHAEAEALVSEYQSITGSIRVDKKTYLPSTVTTRTVEMGTGRTVTDSTLKYGYGVKVNVAKPSGAMDLEDLEELLGV
ncbi:MAG TPA: hypothetical protein VF696_01585 [Candidatus Paceibacterota bacterium]|jgi:hypothetical protein